MYNKDKEKRGNLMIYQKELHFLKTTIRAIYDQVNHQFKEVRLKGHQNVVTSTDLFIEKTFREKVQEVFPNDRVIGEEQTKDGVLKSRTWIIDPIDGTSNYAANLNLFVVQVALYDENDLVLAFIYVPYSNDIYYAIKGHGAYFNDEKYIGTKESDHGTFMISMVGMTRQHFDRSKFNTILQLSLTNEYKLRVLGSIGLEMALTSQGVFDLFYTNVTNLWDICPGLLLLKEAGLAVVNEKGQPYQIGDQHLFVYRNEMAKKIMEEHLLEK